MTQTSTGTGTPWHRRKEVRLLQQQLALYQQYAPTPEEFAQLVAESEANRSLYRATLARNVVLNRKVRELGG